jgi:hypothetical protein
LFNLIRTSQGTIHSTSCKCAGQNEKEQLARIIEVLGLPPKSMVDTSIRRHVFFEPDGSVKVVPIAGTGYTPGGKDLSSAVSSTEQHFLDFMAVSCPDLTSCPGLSFPLVFDQWE